jgi:hypothetical protein
MNLISLCSNDESIMNVTKKNIKRNGVLINLWAGLSPTIFFIHPFPDAGVNVPLNYLTESKKNTGSPYVSISQNSLYMFFM